VYIFVTNEPWNIVVPYNHGLAPSVYHILQALKQNFGAHKLKDDRKVEKVLTRWLITKERDVYQQNTEIRSITSISLIANKLPSGMSGAHGILR
jgi:hypothetical protein